MIGIGSPHGDDQVGLRVAERLAREGIPGVSQHDRPGLDLLDELREGDAFVLVDALRSGARPGVVRVLDPGELAWNGDLSSHAVGVAAVLSLADALGRRPARVRLVGIEALRTRGETLSPVVAAAIPSACARVRELLTVWRDEPRADLAGASADAGGPP